MRFLVHDGASWQVRAGLSYEAARELALGPAPVWIRAEGVPETIWSQLGKWFDLHPLALEDIRNPRQRPKVEAYPEVTFTVVRIPRRTGADLSWTQVGVFLGKGFVLTASPEQIPELDRVDEALRTTPSAAAPALDRVLHRIVDAVVDAWFPFMDQLEDDLEELEDVVLDQAGPEEIEAVRDHKRLISDARKVVLPMREAMLALERNDLPQIRTEARVYLRDVADHMVRLSERLDHVKEVALIAQETWSATLANQQNMVMKRLTVVAALLLVPALLAGIGGMNFPGFPEWDYWLATGFILGVTGLGLLVAIVKGWL